MDDSARLFSSLAGTVQYQQQPSQTQQSSAQPQQPQSFANYVYDPTTGYYYNSTTGLYYDANTQVILPFIKSTLLIIVELMCETSTNNILPSTTNFLSPFLVKNRSDGTA